MQLSIFLGLILVFSSILSSSWLILQVYYVRSIKIEIKDVDDIKLTHDTNNKISIIIAIKNESVDTIKELIENLKNIKYENYEAIIVSDDTPERFKEIISNISYIMRNIKIIRRSENKGRKAGALNYGVKLAQGEYLVFLDAEARITDDFLTKVSQYLSRFDAIAMRLRVRNKENYVEKSYYQMTEYSMSSLFLARDKKYFIIFPNGSAFAIKRNELEKVGGWKEGSVTEDLEMGIRLALFGIKVKFVNDIIVYTLSPFNLTDLYFQIKRWAYGSGELFSEGLLLLKKGIRGIEGFLYVIQWGVYSSFIFSLILITSLQLLVYIPIYFYLISLLIYSISVAFYSISFKIRSYNLHKISSVVIWSSLIGFLQGLFHITTNWRVTPKVKKSEENLPLCVRILGTILFIISFLELSKGLIFESIILFVLFLSIVIVQVT
ncbi:glycosyltransferase family 2 protein [Acidianus sp. HS-5]|uniref:glycosyltransferase n=1 Tax=Acidianus sp. HS-5 TaxID=2886040 RepID=UPI001F1FC267|nr:glycosyltransferase family 2 protein [Acidianus sp. HS-5]BDC18106.1 hypothetical protein HS5_09960 [Acidianus sp. HS-5]